MICGQDRLKEVMNKYLSGTRKKQELFRRVILNEILNADYQENGCGRDIKRINTYKDRRKKERRADQLTPKNDQKMNSPS